MIGYQGAWNAPPKAALAPRRPHSYGYGISRPTTAGNRPWAAVAQYADISRRFASRSAVRSNAAIRRVPLELLGCSTAKVSQAGSSIVASDVVETTEDVARRSGTSCSSCRSRASGHTMRDGADASRDIAPAKLMALVPARSWHEKPFGWTQPGLGLNLDPARY